jgi:hypothetical protein
MVTAAADNTGLNPGKFTNAFDVAVLGSKVAYYEIYTMTVTQVPVLAVVTAFVGTRVRTSALLAGNSEWDPSQPILMTPTDELYLCWDLPVTGTPPQATVWMRYDPALQPVPPGGGT